VTLAVLPALASAFSACGRSGLDAPVDAGGAVGRASGGAGLGTGGAGNGGNPGSAGHAGAGGLATGGIGGSSSGGAGGAQCVPGTSTCGSRHELQLCDSNGVLHAPVSCLNKCVNGACVDCDEGTTRCTSFTTQQTCKGGQWTLDEDCLNVCIANACGTRAGRVFVTSRAFVGGDLGGLTGADEACAMLATAAGIGSSYAAWLSDSTESPATRFIQNHGPYQLVDGTIVANNWADLASGSLRHPIDLTEMGTMPAFKSTAPCSESFPVWTNTRPNGSTFDSGLDCGDWLDPMGRNAALGDSQSTTAGWTQSCSFFMSRVVCEDTAGLYCFEQ
jgi:hypothetical protein